MAEYINSAGIAFNSFDKFILEVDSMGTVKKLYHEDRPHQNLVTPIHSNIWLKIVNNSSSVKTIGSFAEDIQVESGFAFKYSSVTVSANHTAGINPIIDTDNFIYVIMTTAIYNASVFTNMTLDEQWSITGTYTLYRFKVANIFEPATITIS